MELEELRKKYDWLINDINFDELELGLKKPNIFEVLGISNHEIRHSNFLSWLLNPEGSHGLEDVFLKRFLREVFSSEVNEEIDQIEVSELNYSSVEIRREWKNVDLLIITETIVVCVENKIGSSEHSNQLERYKKLVNQEFQDKKCVFVYLTPFGDHSSDIDNYIPISYEPIIDYLERILKVYSGSVNESVSTYIQDYIVILKRELMESDKSIELSKRIYKNHREILDFIIEHKPDSLDRVNNLLVELLQEKGYVFSSNTKRYVRFTTRKIDELTYKNENSNGWKDGESFLFQFEFWEPQNKISFKTVISPSPDGYDTDRLSEILQEIKDFREPKGKKWLVNKSKVYKFDLDAIYEKTDAEVTDQLLKIYKRVEGIISSVEEKFIEHEEELMKMKNFKG